MGYAPTRLGLKADNYNGDASGARLLDLTGWDPQSNGSNTPVFDNTVSGGYVPRFGSSIGLRMGNTTAGDSTTHGKFKLFNTIDMSNIDIISLWIWCHGDMVVTGQNSGAGGSVLFALGGASGTNSSFCNALGVAGGGWHKGWNNITLNKADFASILSGTGVPWNDVRYMQFRHDPGANYSGQLFTVNDIYFGNSVYNNKLPIVVTLDDGNEDGVEIAQIFNSFGIPVSYNIMRAEAIDHVTYPGFATVRQINDLYEAGNDIGIHAAQVNGFAVNPAEMNLCSAFIAGNGWTRNDCHLYGAYPNGSFNQASIDLAIGYGLKGIRSLQSVARSDANNTESSTGLIVYESIANGGIADPFRINSVAMVTAAAAATDLTTTAAKKAAYVCYLHNYAGSAKAEVLAFALNVAGKIAAGTHEAMTFSKFCQTYDSEYSTCVPRGGITAREITENGSSCC